MPLSTSLNQQSPLLSKTLITPPFNFSLREFSASKVFLPSSSSSSRIRCSVDYGTAKKCNFAKPRLLTREDILTPEKENPSPIPYTSSSIRVEIIRKKLQAAFNPVELIVKDITKNPSAVDLAEKLEEHRFDVFMVSNAYKGVKHLYRQQRIFRVLKEELQKGIDEMLVVAITPQEKLDTEKEFAELEKKWAEEAKQRALAQKDMPAVEE